MPCTLKLYVPTALAPTLSKNAAPFEMGVRTEGLGVQGVGGFEEPAMQLNSTVLLYPFTAVTVPLKVAVDPGSTLSGVLETSISKFGVASKLNCHTPRP